MSFHTKNHTNKKSILRPKIGDLVTSTAREFEHYNYQTQKISGAYVFFDNVRSYSEVGPNEKEKVIVDWSVVETGHTLIKSANKNILHRHPIQNYAVDIHPVTYDNVHIIGKCNKPHLSGINDFLKVELLEEFYYIEPDGWRRIHALSKRNAD